MKKVKLKKIVLQTAVFASVVVLGIACILYLGNLYTSRSGSSFKLSFSSVEDTFPVIHGIGTEVLIRASSCEDFVLYDSVSGEVLFEAEKQPVPLDSRCAEYFYGEMVHKGHTVLQLIEGRTIVLEVSSLDGSELSYDIPLNGAWPVLGTLIVFVVAAVIALKLL